ncbi:HD domain-containing phosphohydrolase [Armatimonas sp.]|uniref:HD-GYP domain-containing protein n=1 Tax=Armatimonas sp. TaxID=1872638 RepID=UPI00374D72EA
MTISEQPLSLVTLLASLSYALDLTEGQPMGHAVRTCLIGLRLARELGIVGEERDNLHLALLLKDAGCSSNAARMFALFGGNEILAKHDAKIHDWRRMSEAVKFALRHAAPQEGLTARVAQLKELARQPVRVMDVLTEARCTRGAEIASLLGLSPDVSAAIHALDEHWDGQGAPYHRKESEIPLLARIACLAQTLEVFATTYGTVRAYKVLVQRSGTWFDPELVRAAQAFSSDTIFWHGVRNQPELLLRLKTSERLHQQVTEASLDNICAAFAGVVDAKSSFTGEHSLRVAEYAEQLAKQMGIGELRRATLRRAALLHDLGKLAIPNLILDKPARLTDEEFGLVKKHPYYTAVILGQIPGFGRITEIAAAHHEKLDGTGYHLGLTGDKLDLEMRILAVADILDALTAARPYREAMPIEKALAIIKKDAGVALDADCVEAAAHLYLPHITLAHAA